MGEAKARLKQLEDDNRALCLMLINVRAIHSDLAGLEVEGLLGDSRASALVAQLGRAVQAPEETAEEEPPVPPQPEKKIIARLAREDPAKLARFRAAAAGMDVHEGKGEAVRDAIAGARAAADLAADKISR